AEVGQASSSIIASLDAAARIDMALAKGRYARWAKAIEATVYLPSANESTVISMDTARHPLLGDGAVPLSVELGKDFNLLVITGPNTGGKTVALKTIGLLCLMTQAGLPIPAGEKTRLPIFNGIFADIGDEQSVQEALSTFSGHMSNISRILHQVDDRCLVLLDELGASTDPQEGSAIGCAVLLRLKAVGALGAATSHYTELKVFAHVTPGLQNASFDFNPETMSPTYNLTLGLPGGSNAIATAARFGIPASVIETARGMLADGPRQLEELLTELQAEKQRLEDLKKLLKREKVTLKQHNADLSTELNRLKDAKQAIIQIARDTVIEEVAALTKDLKQARTALERERSLAAVANARDVSDMVRSRLKQGVFQPEKVSDTNDDSIIEVGDRIWLKEAEIEADVVAINDKTGQIEVAAGSLRFKLGREGVIKAKARHSKVTEPKIRILSAGKSIGLELDLRGKRADDIEPLLDEYINDAATANLTEVRIIHGFGTGVVRAIVREQAAKHPLVRSFASAARDQGGDGVTMLRLK
ncbi:MAG: endonuclease MutS2, partial [Dehalococcoidia bacterium]